MKASHLAIVVACGALLLADARCDGRRDGVLRQQIAAREEAIAALAVQAARVDTVRLPATARAYDWAARYHGLRDSLAKTGLVPRHDSATTVSQTDTSVTDPVTTLVRAADSAVATCTFALRTCGTAVAVRDSQITNLTALLKLEREKRGERLLGIPLPSRTVMFGAGILAGFLIAK